MPLRTRSPRLRTAGAILAVLGLLLLALSLGQYAFMFYRQHELQLSWQHQQQNLRRHSRPAAASRPALLKLVIPRLKLDDIVVRGTDYASLLEGPGWMRSSSPPGSGNTVIAGHRDTFFRGIHKLRPGDLIRLERGGHTFRFRVVSRHIISPQDTSPLAPTPEPALTLVTCYPTYWIGPAPKRLIVRARLLPSLQH